MDAAFATIPFQEPLAAEANLAILGTKLPASLWAALPTLLAQVPSPDDALNFLERYLREAPSVVVTHLAAHPAALHHLLLIFSHSRFLSESLVQKPELVLWLHRRTPEEGLDRLKSREDLLEECARFEAMSFEQGASAVFARFKRREYLRILLRDALGLGTLAETTLELSHLADVILERALRVTAQRLENSYGAPQFCDSAGRLETARMTILSLGKLGGEELNYSSDIDLMFLYDDCGQTAGGTAGAISNAEFFIRLAQGILKMISEATPEGAVFRVDLRLRPEGQQGDLAISLPAALEYYRTRAREWERQMLIKARPSAGDLELGRRFLCAVRPLIYRREFHLPAVEAIFRAREELTRELERERGGSGEHAAAWNVKLTPGGIRDIEFLSQCLQRLYGGADEWLAARGTGSTLVALQRLHDKGYLNQRDFFRLATAYQFLRKVEHRLQLQDGLQQHTLPESPEALNLVARRSGVEATGGRTAGEQLKQRVTQHFAEVREIYDRVLRSQRRARGAENEIPEIFFREERAVRQDSAPWLQGLREQFPNLAASFEKARATADSYGRRGLEQLLGAARLLPTLMRELEAHPDWLARATDLFSLSDLAAEMLARNPEGIRLLQHSENAGSELEEALDIAAGAPFEASMAALRTEHRKDLLRTLLAALSGTQSPKETFIRFTRLAEKSLRGALRLAGADASGGGEVRFDDELERAPFAVIALGRLGTSEMDIGSDADLIFLVGERLRALEIERWRRLAERFVHVAGSYTREGLLYPIDTRLRPRGKEGEMLQSAAYLREYFRREAEGWEAATMLKARPVGGNAELAAQTIAEVHHIVAERFGDASADGILGPGAKELGRQLRHTRERMEAESGSNHGRGNFKTGAGGYYDIEYVLAFLWLAHRQTPRKFEAPRDALGMGSALEAASLLDAERAKTLRAATLLYRSLDHAMRIVLGRPSGQLPEAAQEPRIRRLLEKWGLGVSGGLTATVEAARRDVRRVYEGFLRGAPASD